MHRQGAGLINALGTNRGEQALPDTICQLTLIRYVLEMWSKMGEGDAIDEQRRYWSTLPAPVTVPAPAAPVVADDDSDEGDPNDERPVAESNPAATAQSLGGGGYQEDDESDFGQDTDDEF